MMRVRIEKIQVNCIAVKQNFVSISHSALQLVPNDSCCKKEYKTEIDENTPYYLAKTLYWFSTRKESRKHETSTETRM